MSDGDNEKQIVSLVAQKTGQSPSEISLETRLLHDLGITGDDAGELLTEYSEMFHVDMREFEFERYFTGESWWFLGKGSKLPVTVRDLVDAAKQKRWIMPPAIPKIVQT